MRATPLRGPSNFAAPLHSEMAEASMPLTTLKAFMKMEAAGGVVLIAASAMALVLSNSPALTYYEALLETPVAIVVGPLSLHKPLLLWINDGLMAVFFLLVGLEIKREFLGGHLSDMRSALLPAMAAVGGMVVPALIYVGINWGQGPLLNGWAIPAATDIAFALGILALLGSRAPLALKVLLTAVAVIDDLGAIVIIALFYTAELSVASLVLAGAALAGLVALNLFGVRRLAPYAVLGLVLWVCVLKSGVHATLAGVAVALTIPYKPDTAGRSPLKELEHDLHKWVAFGVLPIFGFANAGVSFAGMTPASVLKPVTLGIALGLFIGKQIGVFGAAWLTVRFGLARMPEGVSWAQIYAVSLLCGIGFTMSLFIGSLAFENLPPDQALDAPVRLGVLIGSVTSATIGYMILRFLPRRWSPKPRSSGS